MVPLYREGYVELFVGRNQIGRLDTYGLCTQAKGREHARTYDI